jgi:endonuclease/exonuclease/phosphatase (EEP) superfamily protein YafD
MATRRKPNEYNWSNLEFDARPLPNLSKRSSARRDKIRFIVVHHMTIVGKGDGSANTACINTWKSREASAHYGVDGVNVAQFVWDNLAAWATATTSGNHGGISIEHANSKGKPSWEVSDDTWRTGAKLVAYLCLKYKLGRPKAGTNLRQHSNFFATSCAGPYLGSKIWKAYEKEAQRVYDLIVKGEEPTTPVTPKPVEVEPVTPSTDRMDPAAYFVGATGAHVTWLGERLVAHGFGKHYSVGPGPSFSEVDRLNVADFQKAQGWSGADADGFPGAASLQILAADPVKPKPVDPKPTPEVPPVPTKPDHQTVTVLTLNVASKNADVNKKMGKWSEREGDVADFIIKHGADFVCLQECYATPMKRLDKLLADHYQRKANKGGRVIYRRIGLDVEATSSAAWVDLIPGSPTKYAVARKFTFPSGAVLNLCNAHLSYETSSVGVKKRGKEVPGLIAWLRKRFAAGYDLYVGDFNSPFAGTTRRDDVGPLFAKAGLRDLGHDVKVRAGKGHYHLDRGFAGGIKATKIQSLSNSFTDHNGVLFTVSIPTK